MEEKQASPVKAWVETTSFPTYTPPAQDLNPMFTEKRVNQGTQGRVYPNPFRDRLVSESQPKDYEAVYLENEYIRLMMLPEIGGRIHEALDKTNGHHFIYRQHVIKPALIGLFGAWVSGGMEFNWPQHHRPSTFMPVHYTITEDADGSATVWLSENDPMQRMKGMVGICLRPGKSFFEMKVQLFNRTPELQTFLWWINAAVHVHDQYQVVFPQDVTVVTDHSKRSMAHYPIAKTTYYGIDYAKKDGGTDISWAKNIPVPTSYFVWDTEYDFFGGYDHRADAGILHVANRYIAPGKKMFTWGVGEFGKGWETNLTDEDGPYIELMAGVYTDNQPDFSWLRPYETKTFSQFWYPVQKIGPAKNANHRAALNLELADGHAKIGVAVTEIIENASVVLSCRGKAILEKKVDLAPDAPFLHQVALPVGTEATELLLYVLGGAGDEIIRYAPQVVEQLPLPEAKLPPPPPETFETIEDLYLTGLHLEQYRYPTIDPEPYWEAALERDPTDVRCNNALGLVHYRQGNFTRAMAYFQAAVDKLTRRNPNPRDGEIFYNMGLSLKAMGRHNEAYARFYKATWDLAWQTPAFYALAEIDCQRRDFETALYHLDRSLQTNMMNMKARNLKAAALRHLGRLEEAEAVVESTYGLDPLDIGSRNEAVLLHLAKGEKEKAAQQLENLESLMDVPHRLSRIQAHLDLAIDYLNAGLWDEAQEVLTRLVAPDGSAYPMVLYALGFVTAQMGDEQASHNLISQASQMSPDYCFPSRLEEMLILEYARAVRPDDPWTAYYLGNLYYDKKRYDEAISLWERSVTLNPGFSIPHRNLGVAYYNIQQNPAKAIASYEKALLVNPGDGRVLSELDQLSRRMGVSPEERLGVLEAHMDLVRSRDDLSVSLATLYNMTRQPQEALDYLLSRQFHPWEGGNGLASRQYVFAHRLLGQASLEAGDAQTALKHFTTALEPYPVNLGERKHLLWPDADLHYYAGTAKQALGDTEGALGSFESVLANPGGLSEAGYYQGLALQALRRTEDATAHFQRMLDEAKTHLDTQTAHEFATSVPEFVFIEADRETQRLIHINYVIGLAHLGLGQKAEAEAALKRVLTLDANHFGAQETLDQVI